MVWKCSTASEAVLTNLKSRWGVIHSNVGFFNIILAIEDSFEKFYTQEDVFSCCVEDVSLKNIGSFSCNVYSTKIMPYIILHNTK